MWKDRERDVIEMNMDKQKETFREEAYELLTELEAALLELEERPDDAGQISRAFRAMHTIKGSGAMFGFDDIAEFAHSIESVFDLVRENRVGITRELINLTLSAKDQIKAMLDASGDGDPADDSKSREIIASLGNLVPEIYNTKEQGKKPEEKLGDVSTGEYVTYRIRFEPARDIFKNGTNPLLLLKELRGMGQCKITAYTDKIPRLTRKFDPVLCYIYWDIFLTTDQEMNAVRDVFIFVEGSCKLK